MDGQEVALASWAACVPPLVWLICATLVSVCKRHLKTIEYGAKQDDASVYVDFGGARDFVFSTVVDLAMLSLDLAVNFLRTLLGYVPLVFLFFLCVSASLLMLRYNAEIIFVVDTVYEFLRPNVVETVLQILNFTRVVFALFVGLWNATVEIALIPLRVLFDSAYECSGKAFVRSVALSGAEVVKEFCNVVASFFQNWKREDVLDVDVTVLALRSREFLQKFVEVIECSCDPLTSPHVTRTVAYPLWSATTDTFINNSTRAVLKAAQIPYEAVTKTTTTFEPLFDVVLGENGGVLAAGAALGNEYFDAVTNFVQSGVAPEHRFAGPPVFSLVHRSTATVLEALRTTVNSVAALPEMINKGGSRAADEAHTAGSTYAIKRNFNAFFDVLFVDILSTLHTSWAVYGKVLADSTHVVSETMELGYNFTLDGAVGIPTEKYVPPDNAACFSELRFTVNVFDRTRFAFTAAANSFSGRIVPLLTTLSESVRRVLARDLLLTPTAEVLHSGFLTVVYAIDGLVKTVSYLANSLLRFTGVSQECMQQFQAPYWQQVDDTLTAMPNLLTSFTAFDETNDSGYANLVCARSNHVNHVYSGSLKAYVFASSACATKYDGTQVYPKCSYRSDNFTLQAELCSKLVAYADYNTNPLCATGDELAEVFRGLNMLSRTIAEYFTGVLVAVWNCLAGLGNSGTAGAVAECTLSLQEELRPSSAVYDLLECQVAELTYRFSNIVVSRWTPVFTLIYSTLQYPADGYYATGVDNLQHTQARPVEAAYATAFTSVVNAFVFYPTHVFADAGRDINAFFDQLVDDQLNVAAFNELRIQLQINAMRSSLLALRDVLVGIVEFVRSLDTVTNYREQVQDCGNTPPAPPSVDGGERVETCANPGKVSDSFLSVHTNVLQLVSIIQELQELITNKFVEGMDKFFELLTTLLSSLMNGDTDKMKRFFVELINEISRVLSAVVEGIFRLIITEKDGTTNPFRFLFCDVLGGVKDGVCGFLGFKFIPREFSVKCMSSDEKCAWLPASGKITLFTTKSDENDVDGAPHETGAQQVDLISVSPITDDLRNEANRNMIRGYSFSVQQAKETLGVVWNKAYGQYIPWFAAPGRTSNFGFNMLSPESTTRESHSDYSDYCPLVTDAALCAQDIMPSSDSTTDIFEYWTQKRARCETRKRCDSYYDSAKTSCKTFTQMCTWNPTYDQSGLPKQKILLKPSHWSYLRAVHPLQEEEINFQKLLSYTELDPDPEDDSNFPTPNGEAALRDLYGNPEYRAYCKGEQTEEEMGIGDARVQYKLSEPCVTDQQLLEVYQGTCGPITTTVQKGDSEIILLPRQKHGGVLQDSPYVKLMEVTNQHSISSLMSEFPECFFPPPSPPSSGKRKLHNFKLAMQEQEPTKRRQLLWGAFGEQVEDGANVIANKAKETANLALEAANKATDLAKDATQLIKDTANEAADVVNNVITWVEDTVNTIKRSIPTGKFTITAASIADAANVNMRTLQCEDANGDRTTGLSQCNTTDETFASMEPTVCNSESDCLVAGAACWTPDLDMCLDKGNNPDQVDRHDDYAKSCDCSSVSGGKVHCNYGSGTCQAGPTPFKPPLTSCASAGGLVYGSEGYNSLCYISPLWMCADAEDKAACRSHMGSGSMTLQGPSLCRSFCEPSFENRNNHLVQYRFPTSFGHVDKCVCEVGVDRVFPDQTKASSAVTIDMATPWSAVFNGLAAVTGRRKLLQLGNASEPTLSKQQTKKLFTSCTSSSHCTASFHNTSLCRSLWGDPIPCYSCSERVHGTSRGYGCDAEEKECACTVVRDLDYGDSKLVDIDEWRGNSWCDKIMRGYKTTAMRSPLERVWIHRCFVMRGLGKTITTFLGVPSVPPDFMYNPARLLSVGGDVVEGIFTYYSERFDDDTTDRREEYFDRLVEKNIDPLVTLSVLRVFSVVYNSVTIAFSNINVLGATRTVLNAVDPRAKELLDEGVEMTKPLVTKMREVVSHANFTGFVGHAVSNVRSVMDLVAEARANESAVGLNFTDEENDVGDYGDLPDHSSPTPAVMSEMRPEIVPFFDAAPLNETNDDALYPLDPFGQEMRRRLLVISECTVIKNVRERVERVSDTLDAYYGTDGKYLDATLCAYETFLGKGTFSACGQPEGQSGGQYVDPTDGFPDTDGFSFSVRFVRDTADKMQAWIKKDPTEQTVQMVDFFEENVVGRRLSCDASAVLCDKRQRSLLSAAWVVEGWALIAFAFFKMTGVSSVGIGVFLTVQVSMLFPAILSLAYAFPLSCLPRLPVCLGDDLFDLVTTAFPEHISWPSQIVFNETRGPPEGVSTLPWMQQLGKTTGIEDCRDHLFGDLFDPFFWSREYVDSPPWFTVLEWPLVRFSATAHRISEKWRKVIRNDIIDQCGLINAQGVFPPLIVSFFFYIALSFATVPGIRVGTRAAKRALPNLRRSVMDLLDLSAR